MGRFRLGPGRPRSNVASRGWRRGAACSTSPPDGKTSGGEAKGNMGSKPSASITLCVTAMALVAGCSSEAAPGPAEGDGVGTPPEVKDDGKPTGKTPGPPAPDQSLKTADDCSVQYSAVVPAYIGYDSVQCSG